MLDIGDRLRRVWVIVTGIVVGRRVVPGPRIGKADTEANKCRSMVVAKALVVVAVEVAMAAADMPAVDLAAADMAAAEFDSAAVDMAAAFARKRGVADDYREREKQCYGRCTHSFMLHPPGCQRVTQLVTSGRYFGCCHTIRRLGSWADATPIPPWEWRAAKGALEHRAQK